MPTASSKSTASPEAERAGRPLARPPRLFPAELFLFSDATPDALVARLVQLQAYLGRPRPAPLHDLAFTVSRSYAPGRECLAIVASSHADLAAKLARARDALRDGPARLIDERSGVYYTREKLGGAKLAFLFPGENAQYVNMLAELWRSFPEIRDAMAEADAACSGPGDDFLPSALNFPAPGASALARSTDEMAEWEKAVVLVHTANTGMSRLLEALELRPHAVLGHSFGELSALEMAGVLRPGQGEERVRFARHAYLHLRELSRERELPLGRLLAVGGVERAQIDTLLARFPDSLRVAMENCPHQYVLCAAGAEMDATIAEAQRWLVAEGAICSVLPIRRPYHTAFFEPAFPLEKAYFEEVGVHSPHTEVYSCATTETLPADPRAIVEVAARHWMSPVRFERTIEKMYERGFRVFVDVGPRGNLCAFVSDILKGVPHLALALNRPQRSEIVQLLKGLGLLAAHGVPLRVHHLHERWRSRVVELEEPAGAGPARRSAAVQVAIEMPTMKLDGLAFARPRPLGPSPPPRVESAPEAPAAPLAVAAAPLPDEAGAVMVSYLDTMERFLAVQGELLGALLGPGAQATPVESVTGAAPAESRPEAPAGRFPLLGSIEELVPGESLLARRVFDVREDLYLNDHSLGTTLSRLDPSLRALPVMPIVFSSEVAAEAAAALYPRLKVVALVDVRAHRPVLFESGQATLRVRAERVSAAGDAVEVRAAIQLENGGDPARFPTVFETTVILADDYPAPPRSSAPELRNVRATDWQGVSIYPRFTFHGPLFQGMTSVSRLSDEGVDGTLRVLPRAGLIRSRPDAVLELDPLLLDSQGQGVWVWGSPEPFAGVSYLPYRVGALRLFGPSMAPGTSLGLKMRVRRSEPASVVFDSEAIDPAGHVMSLLEQVALREFPITPALSRLMLEPPDHDFAEVRPLALPLPEQGTLRVTLATIAGFPREILEGSFGVWRRALAFLILSPPEREERLRHAHPARREILWLLGRAAAKDALRHHYRAAGRSSLAPADLVIASDAAGRPFLRGAWRGELPGRPDISISHTDGMVVAVAGGAGDGTRVGVDTETIRTPSPDLLEAAFSAAELGLLPGRPGGPDPLWDEWVLRAWCAKEAVGKALGSGVTLEPRQLALVRVDAATGVVAVRPREAAECLATTFRRGGHALAVAAFRAAGAR